MVGVWGELAAKADPALPPKPDEKLEPEVEEPKPRTGWEEPEAKGPASAPPPRHDKWLEEFGTSMGAQEMFKGAKKEVRLQCWYEGACVACDKKYSMLLLTLS